MSRKKPSMEAMARHREACQKQLPGYRDPESGLFVCSSWYLRQQKTCCGSGCRHCPWPTKEQENSHRPKTGCWPDEA